MKLVIIEGEGKRETIAKYLKKIGDDFTVFATRGHIRDLPANSLAINVNKNFEPKYAVMEDKKAIVSQLLNTAKKADEIYLATDPDREGEAISWHLEHILGIDKSEKCRIEFNEISPKAVEKALKNPREINTSLVDAQQARRVLDRLVGYKLSPILCKKIQGKLSAGRVQSVALRLVVDREREILAFVPEEFWTVTAFMDKDASPFKALLTSLNGKKIKPKCKEDIDTILSDLKDVEYVVGNVKKSVTRAHAAPPFITSTMQQDALNKLGMSLKSTTQAAQQLYEGVDIAGEGKTALVTYIRTDSTRISADFQKEALDYIGQRFGEKFVPEKPNFYKSKKDAQDAHEAIRPINIHITPESIKSSLTNKYQYRLYKLIYDRFLASQMADAEYNSVSVEINTSSTQDLTDPKHYMFKATGKTLLFAGFTAAFASEEKQSKDEKEDGEEEEEGASGLLPELNEGDRPNLREIKPEQKFTKPPARFTEASLVKGMEEKGIGRPATYTPTITTLAARQYTEKDGKYLKPTELGCTVTDMLLKYFEEVMDVGFTAAMEDKLDDIEDGGKVWQTVVGDFYKGFEEKLKVALGDDYTLKEPPEETDIKCDKCGAPMVIRAGKYGKFLACSAYPKCKNAKNIDENGKIIEDAPPEATEEKCPNCGAGLVVKMGKFGKFLACPNYPKCKYIKNMDGDKDADYGLCPKCGKKLRKRRNKRGEDFYGCEGYPDCTFLANFPVVAGKCEKCGGHMIKKTLKDKTVVCCGVKDCGHILSEEPIS